jgi:hypothetical protein
MPSIALLTVYRQQATSTKAAAPVARFNLSPNLHQLDGRDPQ